jgi:hypothetical protein
LLPQDFLNELKSVAALGFAGHLMSKNWICLDVPSRVSFVFVVWGLGMRVLLISAFAYHKERWSGFWTKPEMMIHTVGST